MKAVILAPLLFQLCLSHRPLVILLGISPVRKSRVKIPRLKCLRHPQTTRSACLRSAQDLVREKPLQQAVHRPACNQRNKARRVHQPRHLSLWTLLVCLPQLNHPLLAALAILLVPSHFNLHLDSARAFHKVNRALAIHLARLRNRLPRKWRSLLPRRAYLRRQPPMLWRKVSR